MNKCEVIAANAKGKKDVVEFPDGQAIEQIIAATYLGGQLRRDGAAKPEVENRLGNAATVFRKLTPLWRSSCDSRWKLQGCSAVVFSVLTYGLEALPFTKSLNERVDYFQPKCYRNILKIQVAYYSQVSNKEVLNRVSEIQYQESVLVCDNQIQSTSSAQY